MKTKFTLSFTIFIAILVSFPFMVFAQTETAKFILTPDKTSLSEGDVLETTIKLNTGTGNGVNSYQIHLTYPEDQLTFESVNTEKSPFNMLLESKGGNGQISIVKGSTTTQTGELLVGTVKFKAKATANPGSIKVSNDSAIVRSSDNINILEGSTIQNTQSTAPSPAQSQPEKPKFNLSNLFSKITTFFRSFFKK